MLLLWPTLIQLQLQLRGTGPGLFFWLIKLGSMWSHLCLI